MNIYLAKFLFHLLTFLIEIMDYIYLLLKIYRLLCFAKITFDLMPLYNPYKWPLSFIRIITRPYLSFWGKLLPNIKIGIMSFEISTIIALEFLASILRMLYYFNIFILLEADKLSKLIS